MKNELLDLKHVLTLITVGAPYNRWTPRAEIAALSAAVHISWYALVCTNSAHFDTTVLVRVYLPMQGGHVIEYFCPDAINRRYIEGVLCGK